MTNETSSGVGFSDAGVLALLADTARAGNRGGFGGWGGEGGGGGFLAASAIANGTAENAKIDGVSQKVEDQADCTRGVLASDIAGVNQSFENLTRANEFNRVCDRLAQNDIRNTDNQFRAELRTNDRLLALQAEMNANAREAAKCCCDTKLEMCQMESRLAAKMEALSKEGIARDLDRAERENIYLRTISTCGCGCGGGVRTCNDHHHHGG